ncbi:MAG: hypothetical protein ACYCTI_13165, partial [Acidimicrobiales bacterium]
YTDSTATAGTASNEYCYAVSSIATAGSGASQTGTAQPASPSNPTQGANPGPIAPGNATPTSAPTISSIAALGHTLTVNFDEQINPATVDPNGSDFSVTIGTAVTTSVARAFGTGSTVYIDYPQISLSSESVSVAIQSGADGNTVCAANSTTVCATIGNSSPGGPVTGTAALPPVPALDGIAVSAGTITLSYNIPVDCDTVDTGEYTLSVQGQTGPPVLAAACTAPSSGPAPATSTSVTIQAAVSTGETVTVSYATEAAPTGLGIVASNSNTGPSGNANDGNLESNESITS